MQLPWCNLLESSTYYQRSEHVLAGKPRSGGTRIRIADTRLSYLHFTIRSVFFLNLLAMGRGG
jgi:hypothetical protein